VPIGTEINIFSAEDNLYDAWKGMKLFSMEKGYEKFWVTR